MWSWAEALSEMRRGLWQAPQSPLVRSAPHSSHTRSAVERWLGIRLRSTAEIFDTQRLCAALSGQGDTAARLCAGGVMATRQACSLGRIQC